MVTHTLAAHVRIMKDGVGRKGRGRKEGGGRLGKEGGGGGGERGRGGIDRVIEWLKFNSSLPVTVRAVPAASSRYDAVSH